ncbi:unnamed protein product [Phytophthora lilii]|uniref:Unnamed protein product n=1 Tax=Phytophthora lilii TaxID=2077276 RepID=A0A9W6WM47_9STRA|nr:unnamed protein product [Phytophthora lilii]
MISDVGVRTLRTCSNLSKAVPSNEEYSGLRWQAPECLNKRPPFASDVYYFALCIIEAFVGEPPFAFLDDSSVRKNLKSGEIPEKPEEMPANVWELVVPMTNFDPSKRVSFSHVVDRLKTSTENTISNTLDEVRTITCGICTKHVLRFCRHCGSALSPETKSQHEVIDTAEVMYKGNIQHVVDLLKNGKLLEDGNSMQKEHAMAAIVNLCVDDTTWRAFKEGGIYPPLNAIFDDGAADEKKLACLAIGSLHIIYTDHRHTLCGGDLCRPYLPVVVELLNSENDFQKTHACRIVARTSIFRMYEVENIIEVIVSLVSLLRNGSEKQKECAVGALATLSENYRNEIVRQGIIPDLIDLLRDGNENQKVCAVLAVGRLCYDFEHRQAFVRHGVVPYLVCLARGSDSRTNYASAQLLNKFREDPQLRDDMMTEDAISRS